MSSISAHGTAPVMFAATSKPRRTCHISTSSADDRWARTKVDQPGCAAAGRGLTVPKELLGLGVRTSATVPWRALRMINSEIIACPSFPHVNATYAAATGTAGLVLGALYLHSSGLVFPKMLAVWKQLVIEHVGQVHRDGHFTALMHNLTSGVPDAATCAYTEVAKGDQVERCRAVWIAADPCSPLRNTHQDQHQYRSNTEV
jgi:hypothetical protein